MRIEKIIAAAVLVAITTGISTVSASYPEVSCSSDAAFSENACTQCFDGGTASAWDNLGLLSDELQNNKSMDIIVYKEEQEMPSMVALSSSASWSQIPSGEGFWEYTDAFNALYSESEDGYLVTANSKLTWLESKLGYTYTLDSNTAPAGSNIGLLVYKLISHDVSASGDISIDGTDHNECVLFVSGDTPTTPVTPTPETPTKLPETGPEHILLIVLALLLGFGLLKFTRKA